MLCNICKEKEATVHLTKVDGDKMHKVDLCDGCSKEKNVNDPTGGSLSSIFHGMTGTEEFEFDSDASATDKKCPTCGFSQADFKKAGRFGCPECYNAFSTNLDALLRSMHRDVRHVGKTPKSFKQTAGVAEKLKRLEARMEKAIDKEDFETAAELRDEIGELKTQLQELQKVKP
jgi:protein arginine kinase activator